MLPIGAVGKRSKGTRPPLSAYPTSPGVSVIAASLKGNQTNWKKNLAKHRSNVLVMEAKVDDGSNGGALT